MNQSVPNGKLFLSVLFFLETLVVFCLLFSAVPLCPQQQTHTSQTSPMTDEQKFQQVEDRWSEAIDKRDQYVLELLLSPALIDISATGDVTTRNQQISMLFQKGIPPRSLDQLVVRVRVLANIAVVTGSYTEQLRVNDKTVQQKGVFTHVYENVRGHWLCVVSHRTATGEAARQNARGSKKQNSLNRPLLHGANRFKDTQAAASSPQNSTHFIDVPIFAGTTPQSTHSDAGEDGHDRLSGVGGGIGPRLGDGLEAGAGVCDGFHDLQQIARRSGEAVGFPDGDHVAFAELVDHAVELQPVPIRARDLLAKDAGTARIFERFELNRQLLIFSGDASAANFHSALTNSFAKYIAMETHSARYFREAV